MKKIAIITCLLLSISMFSQTDFRKGFILNNSGQKIQGFINYKENSSMYALCEFKSTKTGNITYYSPIQIKGYGFENDKVFTSKSVNNENFFFEIIVSGTLGRKTATLSSRLSPNPAKPSATSCTRCSS